MTVDCDRQFRQVEFAYVKWFGDLPPDCEITRHSAAGTECGPAACASKHTPEPLEAVSVSLTRRRFLQLSGGSVAVLVAGCTGGEEESIAVPGATTRPSSYNSQDLPFAVWQEVRSAVRSSPDHLVARAEEVVTGGDPQAIFEFVRDRISVLPPRPDGFSHASTDRVGGTRAALRSGWGTPRERADLLADLYRRAGFEAEVVEGAYAGSFDAARILAPRIDLTFAPAVNEGLIQRWRQALQIEPRPAVSVENYDAERAQAARDLLAALPTGVGAAADFQTTAPSRVAAVKVVVDGKEIIADPLLPDAAFGEHRLEFAVKALAGGPTGQIDVRLEASRASSPHLRFALAQGSWNIEEAAGRQIVAGFLPAGDLVSALAMPPELIHSFTPILGLDGADLTPEEVAEGAVVGDTISLFGDVLSITDPGGVPLVNGQPVGASNEASASTVNTLEIVTARPFGFGSVSLRVAARALDGSPVTDLPSGAFTVEDEGKPVPFLLTASRAPSPRVVLLFDTSRSLPAEFLDDQAAELARDMAAAILNIRPDAVFKLAGVLLGTASLSPTWLSDPAEIKVEARRVIGDGSEIWSSLANLRAADASVVVLVSDAQATDAPESNANSRAWVAAGPPVVVVGVGDYDAIRGEDIARTSGGVAVPSTERSEAVAVIAEFLQMQEATPYHFSYRAPAEGTAVRTVRVGCGGRTAEATYAVPPAPERGPAGGLSGLYLTVTVRGRQVIRTLAGLPAEDARINSVADARVQEDVRAALFGSVLLSVEVSPPTLGVWLDEFLTAKLTIRPLWEKMDATLAEQVEALGSGVKRVPAALGFLQSPLPSATFPVGPRIVLLAERPAFGRGELWRADILQVPPAVTPNPDPNRAFAETLDATMTLSLLERDLFQDSAAARLAGRPLAYLAPFVPARRDGAHAQWARLLDAHASYHRLVPADEGPFAFWVIDANGSVLGILPDASGGGSSVADIGALCQMYSQAAAATQVAGGSFGFPFAAFVSLSKAIAQKILKAAAIIRTLEAPEVPAECGPPGLGGVACDLAKDALGTWGKVGKLNYKPVDTADDVSEAAGAGGIVPCP